MNLEQIDTSATAGKAEVMRLAAEGRKVACVSKSREDWSWAECQQEPAWMWVEFDYAIIAEPVGPEEVWLVVREGTTFNSQYDAERLAAAKGGEVVLYRRADLDGEVKP